MGWDPIRGGEVNSVSFEEGRSEDLRGPENEEVDANTYHHMSKVSMTTAIKDG